LKKRKEREKGEREKGKDEREGAAVPPQTDRAALQQSRITTLTNDPTTFLHFSFRTQNQFSLHHQSPSNLLPPPPSNLLSLIDPYLL